MPAAKTPAELTARLADAREEMSKMLADLGTDDLEPAERAAFEQWVCELHVEIEEIIAALAVLGQLVHETDGLSTPAGDSQLSPLERANVLRLARVARKLAREGGTKFADVDAIVGAARKLRHARVSVWTDPVLDEAAAIGNAIIALVQHDHAGRMAWRMGNVQFSGPTAKSELENVRRDIVRAGLNMMDAPTLRAFDQLVTSGRIVLRPEIAADHARSMFFIGRVG